MNTNIFIDSEKNSLVSTMRRKPERGICPNSIKDVSHILMGQNLMLVNIYKTIFSKRDIGEIFSYLKTQLSPMGIEDIFGVFIWKGRWINKIDFYISHSIKNKEEIKKRETFVFKILKTHEKNITYYKFLDPSESKIKSFNPNRCIAIPLIEKNNPKNKATIVFQIKDPIIIEPLKSFLRLIINDINPYIWLLMSYKYLQEEKDVDYLTSLYNRQKLDKKLKKEIIRHKRYNHPLSLIMLDIDHFKNINDSYGHQVGDIILKEIGTILKNTTRATDIPTRYGGEEFCIILPHTDINQAKALAERLRKEIKTKIFNIKGKELQLTVSIGLTTLNGERTPEELLNKVDKALYKAKSLGRDRIIAS